MKMTLRSIVFVVVAGTVLSGCSSMNLFKDSPSATAPEPDLAAVDPDPLPLEPVSTGIPAAQIRKTLSGKSWKWNSPKNSGVTLYANDGSSLVEVTGKGTTTGKWQAKDGQLCESLSPAPFLPNGMALNCLPMTGSGNRYQVGQATFTLQ